MLEFIHSFMEEEGIRMQRTSAQCMDFLQNRMGYSFEIARGVLGLAVAKGYIYVSNVYPVKTYN